mmetsp:Transcript_26953/g.54214  ORF Transcript_26953/g.54214 Transcript_26953/m.54214 type:complete len:235 (+) Transcript_26953:575-1279(+)
MPRSDGGYVREGDSSCCGLRAERCEPGPHQDGGQDWGADGRLAAGVRYRAGQGHQSSRHGEGHQGRAALHPDVSVRAAQTQDQAQHRHRHRREVPGSVPAGAAVLCGHGEADQGQWREPRHLPVGLRRRGKPPPHAERAARCAVGGRGGDRASCHRVRGAHRAALLGADGREAGVGGEGAGGVVWDDQGPDAVCGGLPEQQGGDDLCARRQQDDHRGDQALHPRRPLHRPQPRA